MDLVEDSKIENPKPYRQTKKVKKAKEIKVKRTNGNERETTLKDMYLFGVARNYRDSITYMTNIAPIHKIVCDKATGFIDGLNLYTDQLESFLLKEGHSGYICATYYAKSMKKAEKLYIKLRKKIKDYEKHTDNREDSTGEESRGTNQEHIKTT